MKVRCICIDEDNKPGIIPDSLWVKKEQHYNITNLLLCNYGEQVNVQGVTLAELDISAYHPYNCYKLSRFAINIEDLDKFKEIIEQAVFINNMDIDTVMEEINKSVTLIPEEI